VDNHHHSGRGCQLSGIGGQTSPFSWMAFWATLTMICLGARCPACGLRFYGPGIPPPACPAASIDWTATEPQSRPTRPWTHFRDGCRVASNVRRSNVSFAPKPGRKPFRYQQDTTERGGSHLWAAAAGVGSDAMAYRSYCFADPWHSCGRRTIIHSFGGNAAMPRSPKIAGVDTMRYMNSVLSLMVTVLL
jgi:hypothetical protein